jgi:hypothetical protein
MDGGVIIGTREVWGQAQPFGLSRADRFQHLALFGQTGTGKSTLLLSLIGQDIAAGAGCAILDPHGDLAEAVLDRVPRRRTDDVVIVAPHELAHPVAWNPFYRVPEDERALVTSQLVAALKHVWRDSWGPRLEWILANLIAAVLDAPDHLRPTVLSIPRMLVDERYRAAIVRHIRDPQVRQFWTAEFAAWPERFRAEAISPVQNKIGAVVSAPSLRNLLGQWRPTIDLTTVMEEGRVLVVNLAKGLLGEDKTSLIGSLMVASFQSAAMRRAALPEERRRDFHLYLDEYHSFATDAFAGILSESRKMRMSMTMAGQYLDQASEEVQDAIFGNVGSIVAFRVGAGDAERLARELSEYAPATLRGLPRGQVCARVLTNGEAGQPFLGRTLPTTAGQGRAVMIRAQARQRYGRDRREVEGNIRRWLLDDVPFGTGFRERSRRASPPSGFNP